nr:immunoglobulin light chain junction region [Macaca mulatta]MOV95206.1 immunoglobulin light chain junction region [Macaca mulatta]MOV96445.1 immunoglobulin light chain junction region [Macaca mulatta]MOV98554.1 immunoglobulin light chain junction region [Macaca mulatta]MOV99144.1 immunoglobulin light chain junction region [Macaca mulatta]
DYYCQVYDTSGYIF